MAVASKREFELYTDCIRWFPAATLCRGQATYLRCVVIEFMNTHISRTRNLLWIDKWSSSAFRGVQVFAAQQTVYESLQFAGGSPKVTHFVVKRLEYLPIPSGSCENCNIEIYREGMLIYEHFGCFVAGPVNIRFIRIQCSLTICRWQGISL